MKRLATRGALAVLPVRLLPSDLISLSISVGGAGVRDNRTEASQAESVSKSRGARKRRMG